MKTPIPLTATSVEGFPVRLGLIEECIPGEVTINIDDAAGPQSIVDGWFLPVTVLGKASETLADDIRIVFRVVFRKWVTGLQSTYFSKGLW